MLTPSLIGLRNIYDTGKATFGSSCFQRGLIEVGERPILTMGPQLKEKGSLGGQRSANTALHRPLICQDVSSTILPVPTHTQEPAPDDADIRARAGIFSLHTLEAEGDLQV